MNLPTDGRKFELRDRITFALDHPGEPLPEKERPVQQSKFDWARSKLTLQTKITDNIRFGPNFRNFMRSQIGTKFTCHSDFMDWAKLNPGRTLEEAVFMWHELENRKKNPDFKRVIAKNNMLAQYVRDFLEDNPKKTLKDALYYWKRKKQMPTETGFITYEASDLTLL